VGEVPELGDAALGTTRRRVRLSRILRRATIGGESVTTTTQQRQRMGSPMRNEAYYLLSALSCKLEGLAAYRTYAHDGNNPLWQQFSQTDNQATETLLEELEWRGRDHQFRKQTPGRAGYAVARARPPDEEANDDHDKR
jgi:hypothetical protein